MERPKKEAKDTLERYPTLRNWVDGRPDLQKPAAEKMIGTIASLEMEDDADEDRANLFRAGILAFERVGIRALASDFEDLGSVTAEKLLPLLGQQDVYEASLWADILRSRVDAIGQLQNLTDADELEKVLQKHLYNHLWLLDPAWERATVGGEMEEFLSKLSEHLDSSTPGFLPEDNEGNEVKGRIDIRYANATGEHVIVELKRYKRAVDVDELYTQGLNYYNALRSILSKQQAEEERIEIVFVLGDHPTAQNKTADKTDREYRESRFEQINARYVLYDRLIRNAKFQYDEYLKATDKAHTLEQLLEDLGSA